MRLARFIALLFLGVSLAPGQTVRNGSIQFPEISAPSNPPANSLRVYVCDDAGTTKLCSKDSAGTVSMGLGGGAGHTTTFDVWANRPGSPSAGDVFYQTDGLFVCAYTGSVWDCQGFGFHGTACDDAGTWSWLNQGTSTIAENGTCYLTGQAAATDDNRIRYQAISGAWRIEILISPNIQYYIVNGMSYGVYGIDLDGGTPVNSPLVFCGFAGNASEGASAFVSRKWTDVDTFSADYASTSAINMGRSPVHRWLALADDTVNRTCQWSNDGENWHTFHTVASGDFLAIDNVGFGMLPSNSAWSIVVPLVNFTP